ncbi:hypothetical protein J6590_078952 [Homalodisca vitripennis]|nr:hypothetical protein J6590_078952 [Homalodisca vitripennis]
MIPPEQQGLEGEPGKPPAPKKSSLKGDRGNVCLLMFLYMLQGIPLGLGASVPMLLQSKGVSYNDQAIFSLVGWPFSIKLLWAPIVDSVYSERFGRRKSWLVPAQYLIGICMLTLSSWVDFWIEDTEGPRIVLLTGFFFVLCFLAATQDVAVDGWALSMLRRLGSGHSSLVIDSCVIPIPGLPSTLCDGLSSTPMDRGRKPCVKENVGYASTCNSVGQTAGFFVSFFVFTALESADFCNTYLRTEPLPYGVVTLSSFLKYFGWVFLVTTTLVMLLKREGLPPPDEEPCAGILDTYKQLARVMQLPALKKLAVILLTMSVSRPTACPLTHPAGFTSPKPMCHLNLGNIMDVKERDRPNVEILGCKGNSISLVYCGTWLLELVGSLTSEVLASLNKRLPPPAYFDWRGRFRVGLPFFRRDMTEISVIILPYGSR